MYRSDQGVRTKAGTYNQEYHPHALLLELGSDYNSGRSQICGGTIYRGIASGLREGSEIIAPYRY